VACAVQGGGTISMTVWVMQVESDNHWENMRDRRCRVSFDLRSRGGILRLRAATIFVTFS
jgi:hypothetical protein